MDAELLVYFTDVFGVEPADLEEYGAFNISLVNDLPLFIDPFLLFNSKKPEYQSLHAEIIQYLRFLRDKAAAGQVTKGLLTAWFTFKEVKQNWLGFSKSGNTGSGLGIDFAEALLQNLSTVFESFGAEKITRGSHLEKLTLIRAGVGRDNISDFTTTLTKRFLLEYTQAFTQKVIHPGLRKMFTIARVSFNYQTESWEQGTFDLPAFEDDFVLLTPKDILTKDETWINRRDLLARFDGIADSLPDAAVRDLVNNHLRRQLSKDPTVEEIREAKAATIQAFPQVIELYIKEKEDDGDKAESVSKERVRLAEQTFIADLKECLIRTLFETTLFYVTVGNTKEEARKRVLFFEGCD